MNTEVTKISDENAEARGPIERIASTGNEGDPFLICDWSDFVVVHYEVTPTRLQPAVPFPLDLYDGKAFLSLVSFTMSGLRPPRGGRLGAWLFQPIARHEFLNLRTYVRHGQEPAIYFLAEWLPNRLSVLLGPWIYGLPYRHARIRYRHEHDGRGEVVSKQACWRYRVDRDAALLGGCCEPGSLDEFLFERYLALTDRGLRHGHFRVWHEPWRLTPVRVNVEDDSLCRVTGSWFAHARPVAGHVSAGVENVWIGRPRFAHVWKEICYRCNRKSGNAIPWVPPILLLAGALSVQTQLPAWAFMWALVFAIYAGCKWLTWWQAREPRAHADWRRQLGYLLLWPGMDAEAFLDVRTCAPRPSRGHWIFATAKTACGAALLWGVAPLLPADHPLLVGWTGMIGLIFLLHFGAFHLLALIWRSLGVDARAIMRAPILSRSLREFWGQRWNAGFHDLARRFLFKPFQPYLGPVGATIAVFLASGLIHDLVISVPAGGGYGLPTAYFLLQGVALVVQRKRTSWLFTLLVTAGPAFWLFHPPFVHRVILPFLHAIGAR